MARVTKLRDSQVVLDNRYVNVTGDTMTGDLSLGTNNLNLTGSIGATGARVLKGWFTDLQVTNVIAGSITGNATTVTTNANLTGVITSVGNATSIAFQTGTGSKFVVDTSPTIVTPTVASLIGNKIYPSADSTTAIQINKADGTTNVLNVDTTNGNVGIGTAGPGAKLQVNTGAATTTGIIIKGAVSQSANLQEWQDSNANALFAHSAGFDTLFRNTSDSGSSASPNTLSFYGKNGSGNDTLITKLTIGKIGGGAGDIFGQFNIGFRTSTVFSLSEANSTKQLTLSLAPASSGFLNVNLTAGSDQTATTPILNLNDSTGNSVVDIFHNGSVYALRDFISPNGGIGQYANLLTYSEDFTNAIWIHAGTFTVTGNAITAPNGMVTADSVNFGASSANTLTQTSNSAAASKTYTASIWYKYFINSGTGGNLTLTIGNSTFSELATTAGSINSTVTTWKRLVVTKTFTAGATGNVAVQLNSNHPSGDNWGAYIWGAQLEENPSAGPYAFTSSSTVAASQGMILNNPVNLVEGVNIILGTSTGTKIGTATSQKLGFYNVTPVVQQAHIANADGTLADITSKFNTLLSYLQNLGLLAAV